MTWSEHRALILKADTLFKMQLLPTYGFFSPWHGQALLVLYSFLCYHGDRWIFFLAITIQGQGIHKQKRWELTRTLFLQLAANDCILEIDGLPSH